MDISCVEDEICIGNEPLAKKGEFSSFYTEHTNAEIESHFGISESTLSCVKSLCGLTKNPALIRKKRTQSDLEEFIRKAPFTAEEFIQYNLEHSRVDTIEHFSISYGMFVKLKKHFGIKKSKKDIALSFHNSLIKHYGTLDNYKKSMIETRNQSNMKKYGVDEWFKSDECKKTKSQQIAKGKKTNLKKYGAENVFQNEDIKEKSKETKLKKYGDEAYTNQNKASHTMQDRYGTAYYTGTAACYEARDAYMKGHKDEIYAKVRDTNEKRYGTDNYVHTKAYQDYMELLRQNPEYEEKRLNTLRKHHTFNTSKPEKDFLAALSEFFAEDDIKYQYQDSRYPFACDFYIKSLDLFIELNCHWTHGGHPFDSRNGSDIDKLNKWKQKQQETNSKFYKNAIYVWTDLDIRKRSIASSNHLNYIMLYNKKEIQNLINICKNKDMNELLKNEYHREDKINA